MVSWKKFFVLSYACVYISKQYTHLVLYTKESFRHFIQYNTIIYADTAYKRKLSAGSKINIFHSIKKKFSHLMNPRHFYDETFWTDHLYKYSISLNNYLNVNFCVLLGKIRKTLTCNCVITEVKKKTFFFF